ncbi:MAG TPA: RDD family protein, partial [Nitrososphaeraceae archaeon]|nr:RDD family protein [Nitrososphaeraceae archaeon]
MLQRGYIILIIGTALLISGIIISALWAGSFAGTFMRENTILSGVSIRPVASVNASIQVMDTSRPVSLAIHVERNNINGVGSGAGSNGVGEERREGSISNNTLREAVRNPNGLVMTSNEFTKQFFTTFKPDVTGKYTITVYNLGNTPVSIGVLVGNLPFVGANNQPNINFLGGIIAGVFLIIAGIIVLIAGVIVLALDRRRLLPKTETSFSPSSSTATTKTERIVLASWIDRFVAWLIDFIIVSIGLGIIFAVISIPFWIAFSHSFDGSSYMNMATRNFGPPWFPYVISSIIFMAYWTYFESTTGQSIG